ncbi:MAG: flagellar hook-length control protein FliK [Zetaproteobacteria bacterium]|nr:MAG: flagellar hook-length control protein FliK [Zetaproteobacteria bacterium]
MAATPANALRIVGGNQLKLAPGARVTMQVARRDRDLVLLSDGRRTVMVEGLPPSLRQGTRITLFRGGDGALHWSRAYDAPAAQPPQPTSPSGVQPPPSGTAAGEGIVVRLLDLQPATGGRGRPGEKGPTPSSPPGRAPLLPTGMVLEGRVGARDGSTMELLLAPWRRQDGVDRYPSGPLRITTSAMPGARTGMRVALQIEADGRAHLFLAGTPQPTPSPTLSGTGGTAASARAEPIQALLAAIPEGETALLQVEAVGQRGEEGMQLRMGARRFLAPAPPPRLAGRIHAGDGLMLRNASSSTDPTKTASQDQPSGRLEAVRLLPALDGIAQRLLRARSADRPPPIAETLTRLLHMRSNAEEAGVDEQAPVLKRERRAVPEEIQGGDRRERLLQQLDRWLERARVDADRPLTGARLAEIIDHAGHALERKLLQLAHAPGTTGAIPSPLPDEDLKAILLRLMADHAPPSPADGVQRGTTRPDEAGKPPRPEAERAQTAEPDRRKGAPGPTTGANAVRQEAAQGVQRIEGSQLHALLSTLHHQPVRVEFPLAAWQQLVTVQMALVDEGATEPGQDGRREGDARPLRVLIALDLSALGAIRIDAAIAPTLVSARIHLEQEAAERFVADHIDRLQERLHTAGFDRVQLTTTSRPPEPARAEQFARMVQMVPATRGMLDIEA